MSIATVVTHGYGTFGNINFLPTLGYDIGVAIARIGPLTTQNVFRADIVVGDLRLGETLGIFRENTDEGDLKP